MKKILIAIAAVLLLALFFYFDLGRFLTLDYLKTSQARFQSLYAQNPVGILGAYMLLYIVVTALSLPGAAVLTLAGGALFGFVAGTVAVSFASTIGATLACAVARYLLRDAVQARFGGRLAAVNRGIEEEGAFYLFSVRLIPVFPFFVVNVLFGLTRIRLTTYFWVSQLGMLPATMVYVNAGRQLAAIDSLSGILSPGLLASFVLLGIFPMAARRLLALARSRRAGKRG